MKQFQFRLNELKDGLKSVFSDRTDDASAVQYFQVIICSHVSTKQQFTCQNIFCIFLRLNIVLHLSTVFEFDWLSDIGTLQVIN